MIGTKLAHYEITSHLGSGGMGDVYQAVDNKLGRNVAIKILPEAFARDAERVARFEREARALASLNHVNIAAIHGIEEFGGRNFLVMELVEGETLAKRIERGPWPVEEVLQVARQIAEALEAAHAKGITHRDLKPANVKITPDGKVKVLDFGLAKAIDPAPGLPPPSGEGLSNSPTLMSMSATNLGVILGTAPYISPEQAKGTAVDRRSDIFSFGSVVYEMLTGKQPFSGETTSEILAAVLKAEPAWDQFPLNTPPAIRRLLRRCLQKDRSRRLQHIADARIEIDEAQDESALTTNVTSGVSNARHRAAWIPAIVAGLAALLLAMPALRHYREVPPAQPPEMRVDIVTSSTPDPLQFAISPDGQRLVYMTSSGGSARLWLRPLNAVTAQPLAETEGAALPFWSPDSRSIGFFAGGLCSPGRRHRPLPEHCRGIRCRSAQTATRQRSVRQCLRLSSAPDIDRLEFLGSRHRRPMNPISSTNRRVCFFSLFKPRRKHKESIWARWILPKSSG